jgi:4-amino-4-deoxy-L-arabinose transferase-like glycosyltransferase
MDQIAPQASANRMSQVQRTTRALLILCSVALLGSSVYRAATLSFGIDESLSFAIFTWKPYWGRTANNHLLNTALMHWSSVLFGNSELSLRLPNLAAHGLYLLSVLALVKRVRDPTLQVIGFVLFTLNLLLAEYFIVARGYGLAVAFEMLSLYLFVRAYQQAGQGHLARDLYLSVGAGALAVLSNFAWANYFVPLLLASGWVLLTDASPRRVSRGRLATTLGLFACSGLFLFWIVLKLLKLQRDRQMYWGGYNGFVSDTINSLARCSLYPSIDSPAVGQALSTIFIASFALVLPLGIRQLFSRKNDATFGLLVLLLAGAVALPLLEHAFFHALFPIERAALYYLPLYAAVLLYGLSVLGASGEGWRRAVAPMAGTATAVAAGWCFCRGFTERSPCAWVMDTHNREVLDLIERDHAEHSPTHPVKIRASHLMEPSLNFYRITHDYTWLVPVTRKPIPDPDYIYTFERELRPADHGVVLASYPDLHTVLLRVSPAERR